MEKHTIRMLIFILVIALAGCQKAGGGFVYSGSIEGTEIPIQSELAGTVQTMSAAEGQTVKAGDTLARFDDKHAMLQIGEAKAAVEAAQAKWEEAKAGSRSEELSQAAAQLEQARKVTEQARSRVKGAEEQVAALTAVKDQLTHDLASANETLRYHEKRLRFTQNLYDKGDATQEQVDSLNEAVNQARMQVVNLDARIKTAEAQIAQARHETEAAVAQKDQAAAGEKAAEAKLALVRAGSTDYQLRNLLALKDQAESRLAQIELTAQKTVIASPDDGIILRKHVENREVVKAGATLYTLLKSGELKITVYVPEAHLNEVGIGQTAEIAVDAYPGSTFKGKVTRIAEKAEFTPKNVQTPDERTKMVLAVTVQVSEGSDKLKPGMPADVRFQSAVAEATAK